MLLIRNYFFRIRILGPVILYYGSRYRRKLSNGADWIRILPGHFCGHWQKYVSNPDFTYLLNGTVPVMVSFRICNNRITDSDPGCQLITGPSDPDPQHFFKLISLHTYFTPKGTQYGTIVNEFKIGIKFCVVWYIREQQIICWKTNFRVHINTFY